MSTSGVYTGATRPPRVNPQPKPTASPHHHTHSFKHALQHRERAATKPESRTDNNLKDDLFSSEDEESENISSDKGGSAHGEAVLFQQIKAEFMSSSSDSLSVEAWQGAARVGNGERLIDSASSVMNLDDFSMVLDQVVQNRLLHGNKEWRFLINLPAAQITLTSTAAARWSVGLSSSTQADNDRLSKYKSLLELRLKELGQTVEGIEVVSRAPR